MALASQAPGFDALRPHRPDQAEAGIDRLRDTAARQGRDALGAALDTQAGRTFFAFLFGNSPHLSLLLQRDPEFTQSLVEETPDALTDRVRGELAGADPAMDRDRLMTFLRRRRNRVAVIAAVHDCFGIRGVMDCAELLSDMADHAVRLTASHLLLDRVQRGDLEPPAGERWGYFVLAMGKHGSRELNYSSDIDLIVMYDPEAVRYTGRRTLSDCFVRVTQDLVRILQTRTGDGYVFRTDLRLRPDPSSTPVAITVDFAMNYYQRFGRTWERTALIKARPVAGDLTAGAAFMERLSPFIWDEGLDFTSVEEIRSMSQQIHDFHGHGAVRAPGHNVKLGRGGIREIEFFVHMHQLAYGGRNRRLRGPRLLAMLETLDREHHIMPRETAALRDSYLLLRRVEHRLQMVNDAQTQKLPESDEGLEHVAAFLGLDSKDDLVDRIERTAAEVHDLYRTRFNPPETEQDITAAILEGPDENPDAVAKLEAAGFTQALTAIETFRGWAEGRHASTGSERARAIIREILHEIVDAVGKTPDPDRALDRMDRFLATLPEDISFFSMLRANTWLLNLIAVVMGSAPRMADILGANPRLLQAVLDPSFFLPLPGRERLAQDLDERLEGRRDAAARVEQVTSWAGDRRFQVGVQTLQNLVTVDEASTSLSDVAAVVIDVLFRDAIAGLQEHHGPAPGGGCAVVALGKLGAAEMTFESDLDLRFVADLGADRQTAGPQPIDARSFYRRAAGELVAHLRSRSTYGQLYEVDERLRPSGRRRAGRRHPRRVPRPLRRGADPGPDGADARRRAVRRRSRGRSGRGRNQGSARPLPGSRTVAAGGGRPASGDGRRASIRRSVRSAACARGLGGPGVLRPVPATAARARVPAGAGASDGGLLRGAGQRRCPAGRRGASPGRGGADAAHPAGDAPPDVAPGRSGAGRPGTVATEAGRSPRMRPVRGAAGKAARDAGGGVRGLPAPRRPAGNADSLTAGAARLKTRPIRPAPLPFPRSSAAGPPERACVRWGDTPATRWRRVCRVHGAPRRGDARCEAWRRT